MRGSRKRSPRLPSASEPSQIAALSGAVVAANSASASLGSKPFAGGKLRSPVALPGSPMTPGAGFAMAYALGSFAPRITGAISSAGSAFLGHIGEAAESSVGRQSGFAPALAQSFREAPFIGPSIDRTLSPHEQGREAMRALGPEAYNEQGASIVYDLAVARAKATQALEDRVWAATGEMKVQADGEAVRAATAAKDRLWVAAATALSQNADKIVAAAKNKRMGR